MNDFSDWEKEMQAKMSVSTSGSAASEIDTALSSSSTMEQFHNWQAEIEAKMEDL